ncbi:MAG: hypothetical protein JEZ14_26045 [Marinilabiliaceae bacterium]|nr:hypothetical protein [Marinilabiliaceae bacterium]
MNHTKLLSEISTIIQDKQNDKAKGVLIATMLFVITLMILMGGCLVNKSINQNGDYFNQTISDTEINGNEQVVTNNAPIIVHPSETVEPEPVFTGTEAYPGEHQLSYNATYAVENNMRPDQATMTWEAYFGIYGGTPVVENRKMSFDNAMQFASGIDNILFLKSTYDEYECWQNDQGVIVQKDYDILLRYYYWGFRRFNIFASAYGQYPNTVSPELENYDGAFTLDDPLIGSNVPTNEYPMFYPYQDELMEMESYDLHTYSTVVYPKEIKDGIWAVRSAAWGTLPNPDTWLRYQSVYTEDELNEYMRTGELAKEKVENITIMLYR